MEFKNYIATKNKEGKVYIESNNISGIHTGKQAVLLPNINSTPQQSIQNINREIDEDNKYKFNNPYLTDKPLSGTDPIGEFIVSNIALGPAFKLAGKAALYGAGRLGSNYARAKLISGAMQEVGTLENKIPLNVGWGPKQNLNVYHASDSPIDKFKFPNKDNWAVKTNNHPSDIIYFSEGDSPASGFLSKRQYVQNYNIKLNKPMVQVGEVQNIPTKNIERNKLLRFAQSNNADAYIMQDIADNQMKHQNIISNFSDKNINKVFKSEIDWNKWNKEIPQNKPLLNEYNNIEMVTKADGSWMKNTNGSTFKGPPEQFIQQRSQNFKTWFGDWSNSLRSNEIVFGHPGIGKTFSFEKGKYKNKFIDWDVEFNGKRDKWIEKHSNTVKGTEAYKKVRNEYLIYPEKHKDYSNFITNEWNRVKEKAKLENKILFASPHTLLKMFPEDFTRIINLSTSDFIQRNVGRGGKEIESRMWKNGIDKTINSISNTPVIIFNKGEYLEDYLDRSLMVSKVVD